ncbi:MAG: PDZ domain-containing protein [Phycisphaerae bacterium]
MRKYLLSSVVLAAVAAFAWVSLLAQDTRPLASGLASAPVSRPAVSLPASAPTTQELIRKARKAIAANQKLVGLFKAGKFAAAREMLDGMIKDDPENEINWYNLACAYSRLGNKDQAFDSLGRAVELGYSDFTHLERDEDFDALRKEPRYKALLARRDEIQRERAAKILDTLRQRFGEGYICEIDHDIKLVVATNVDRQTLDNLKARLTRQAAALWNDLFSHKFEQYITVVISKTDSSNMYGVGGFYNHAQHMLTAKTVGMTVTHEFTHALHAADMEALGQQHNIWVIEGLGSLFELSEVTDGHIKPLPNERLISLKAFIARKQNIPWIDFMRAEQPRFMRTAAVSYGQCRYMMMYLHEKGKLKAWYEAYCDSFADDPSGIKAMEKVFDKPLGDIEKDWLAWVRDLKPPAVVLPPNHAYIGVRVAPVTDGVQIADVVRGSGADDCGLKPGDVIFRIDQRDIFDPVDLVTLVDGHEVGDKVDVQYRRNGQYKTVQVLLKAMPGRGPQSIPATKPASTSTPATAPAGIKSPSATPTPAPASAPATRPGQRKAA